jgi:fatty acid-binding protein DegV
MSKTIITTDSGINPINHNNMIPGIIINGNNTYYDTIKMDEKDDIKAISSKEILSKRLNGLKFSTSAPSYSNYMSLFNKLLDEGKEIVHLSMSGAISSGSVNMANNVISEIKEDREGEIYLVDTLTGGSGGTIIAKLAEDLASKGLNAKEIKEQLEIIKHNILSTYYISDFSGYRESGRVPKGTKFLDMLSVRYRIDINDKGALYPKKLYRGKIDTTSLKYVKELINENNIYSYDSRYVSLLNMPFLNKINKEELIDYIKSFNYFNNILEDEFLGTITAYGVRDQLGIGLLKK